MARCASAPPCSFPPPLAEEIDGLRRAFGDRSLGRVPPHLTLVPPVNVAEGDLGQALAVLRAAAADRCRPPAPRARASGDLPARQPRASTWPSSGPLDELGAAARPPAVAAAGPGHGVAVRGPRDPGRAGASPAAAGRPPPAALGGLPGDAPTVDRRPPPAGGPPGGPAPVGAAGRRRLRDPGDHRPGRPGPRADPQPDARPRGESLLDAAGAARWTRRPKGPLRERGRARSPLGLGPPAGRHRPA